MNLLDKLTAHQRRMITSLPYRVGLLVSKSDASGGTEADEKEQQALSNILHGFAEHIFGSETVQYIISETIKKKEEWPGWSQDLESVPNDCAIAVDVLREFTDDKDVAAFQNHLIEIAEAVALAFHENKGRASIGDRIGMLVSYMKANSARGKDKRRKRSLNEYTSISLNERRALDRIAKALGTSYS